jgi:hypothetical protein
MSILPQEPGGLYEIERFKYMMANWKQTWEVTGGVALINVCFI